MIIQKVPDRLGGLMHQILSELAAPDDVLTYDVHLGSALHEHEEDVLEICPVLLVYLSVKRPDCVEVGLNAQLSTEAIVRTEEFRGAVADLWNRLLFHQQTSDLPELAVLNESCIAGDADDPD